MTFKETIYLRYQELLRDKTILIEQALADLSISAANETKSSAGDKHETALALLQIEQENKRHQLRELQTMAMRFNQINPCLTSPKILFGSLVQTGLGYFYISVALGCLIIERKKIHAISISSPLGKKILGLQTNEIFCLNGKDFNIISVE
jgi:hypothetical protein